MTSPAVFLDRDGVLIHDVNLLTDVNQVKFYEGAMEAIKRLKASGFTLVVITNQPVVARGLITEKDVETIHAYIAQRLDSENASVDGFYFCPHHPRATLPQYRMDCDCRKPRPGMLVRASQELDLALRQSYMVGDRITDVIAGEMAGCHTILVRTGMDKAPLSESPDRVNNSGTPEYTCDTISAAANFILGRSP